MIFRIAKKQDASIIAKIHLECAKNQTDGFMHKLGFFFLSYYYKIFINERCSLILVAEDNGTIYGFHSGTLKSEEHQKSISNNRIILLISVFPQFFLRPGLFLDVLRRFKTLKSKDNSYRVSEGPRGEYWAWLPSKKDPENSLKLHKVWHNIMREIGVKYVRSEVDLSNNRVVKSIKLMGGIFIEEVTLPDGRRRAIVEYKL